MAFPSFNAEAMRAALPEEYFGVRPPPAPGAASPRARRAPDINDLPRKRGPTYSGRNGSVLRRQQGYGKGRRKAPSTAGRVFHRAPSVPAMDGSEGLEYEYHRSPVARPRKLGGGHGNIRSEVVVRRELRELIKVKNSIPSDREAALLGKIATLQDFFAEFEPLNDGSRRPKSKYTTKQIRGMLKRTPDFGVLCARLGELYPMSPLSFATADLVEETRRASAENRQAVEETMALLRTEGRLWPGDELVHGIGEAPVEPEVNPLIHRGIVQLHTGFAITEAPMKNLKGAMAAKVEGTLTPEDRMMTARVEDALLGVKRSYFPHSRQGRLRESEQPRESNFRRLNAVHGSAVIVGGQSLAFRARRQAELENEAAAHSAVVIDAKSLQRVTRSLLQVKDPLTGQAKKEITEADWQDVMAYSELPLDGDEDYAQRLFAHFVRLKKDIVRDNTFKKDRKKLFVSTVPMLKAALTEPELRKLKEMVHEIEVHEGEVVEGLIEKRKEGSETLYFVDEGEVVAELDGEVVHRYTAGQWWGEDDLISGPTHKQKNTYRAVGTVQSRDKMPGAVVTRGAILYKINAHDIDLIGSNRLQKLISITQMTHIIPIKNSITPDAPMGRMHATRQMNCVIRRQPGYSRSIGNLADGEIFDILEDYTDKEGKYHVRMQRAPTSVAGPPIESGWVTATSFAAMEGQEGGPETVVDVDVIISCMTMLVNGSAADKLQTYFAMYLSEDTSTRALGSTRCTDPVLLPRFFDTIANHYSVPALVLEQLARDTGIVMNGGPDPLAHLASSTDGGGGGGHAHEGSLDGSTGASTAIATLTWDWFWRACELTKDLNDIISRSLLSLRSIAHERGSERVERAASAAASLQARHAAALSPSGVMQAGNISPKTRESQAQRAAWRERRRWREEEEEERSRASPSRMLGSTRSLASPNSSYGTMATWELLEEDTDLREERLAQEMAEAMEDSGYIAGMSSPETYVETIGPPIGMDRTGRRSLTSYKERRMLDVPKFVSREDEAAADHKRGPSAEDSMREAVRAWHSQESITY